MNLAEVYKKALDEAINGHYWNYECDTRNTHRISVSFKVQVLTKDMWVALEKAADWSMTYFAQESGQPMAIQIRARFVSVEEI